jgi:phosphoglycerate dehydrogenase-like enzyme
MTDVLVMYDPSPAHLAALGRAAPGARLRVARDEAGARELIRDADAVLGNRWFLQSVAEARRLRWMQSGSHGVDLILSAAPPLGEAVLTCARGVYDDEVADHALALLTALTRGLHRSRDDRAERRWQARPLRTLAGARAVVVGWGGIGRATATRLHAFGMTVEGVRRRHAGAPYRDGAALVHGPETWREALNGADVLVLALPLTAATHHLVAADELARLAPRAIVVNVGRGGTLDDGAVFEAVAAGRLAGAGLDVLEVEPPPPSSPAWSLPDVLLSAHVARSRERAPFRWEALFEENLRRFATGEPLLNVVDRAAGY